MAIALKEEYINMHDAIHDPEATSVVINGITYPIEFTKNTNLRHVKYKENNTPITFIEQNTKANSDYARRARDGENITWGMRDMGGWIFIDQQKIAEFELSQKKT